MVKYLYMKCTHLCFWIKGNKIPALPLFRDRSSLWNKQKWWSGRISSLKIHQFYKIYLYASSRNKIPLGNKAEGKYIINYSGWYFWVAVLGSLAVLRVAGAPHPATVQYEWVGRCAAEGALSALMRCSHYENLLCVFTTSERGKWLSGKPGVCNKYLRCCCHSSLCGSNLLVLKFLIIPASFQTWALHLLLCLKQVLGWESRDCCSLTAWAGAAGYSHSAQRDLGRWHQTALPWDAPAVAGLVQPGLALHWCPGVSLSEEFARWSPCRTPGCVLSLCHDPKTVSDNISRKGQRNTIYSSWSKQKSCLASARAEIPILGARVRLLPGYWWQPPQTPIRIAALSCCAIYIY